MLPPYIKGNEINKDEIVTKENAAIEMLSTIVLFILLIVCIPFNINKIILMGRISKTKNRVLIEIFS